MKRQALAVTLSFGAAFTAHAESLQCNFESDYKFSQQGHTLIFSKDVAPGRRIMIQDGRMVIDGKELSLSNEDRARVSEFESEMRLLIPQVKQVTTEAIDIAFAALIEVSRGLNGEQNNPTIKKLQNAQVALRNSIEKNPGLAINDDIGKKIIEPIVTDFVPDVVGSAVRQALSLAFSGDDAKAKAFEKRMDNMGKEIETKVEARAKNLEPLAQAMCTRVRNMDIIEGSISVRLSNTEKINLFDTKAP
ncbi:MAG: DUF2884 family protein [Arenimonas sp.]